MSNDTSARAILNFALLAKSPAKDCTRWRIGTSRGSHRPRPSFSFSEEGALALHCGKLAEAWRTWLENKVDSDWSEDATPFTSSAIGVGGAAEVVVPETSVGNSVIGNRVCYGLQRLQQLRQIAI